ncbi:MAG TPA: MogA/MoaB family molybdenum cofactor biosynthesis protein [Longilinea sp.]|nr:MogA/MoaB family molybdenum cofactor biosynthesis protein [Longilinea sp.]
MDIRCAILTVSDRSSRDESLDLSGPTLAKAMEVLGWKVTATAIVPDEQDRIKAHLLEWSSGNIDLILTTGGTGFAPRDVTPEATLSVLDKQAPGLSELMRRESYAQTPHAALSRAVAGVKNRTLIVNLPGSPQGALQNFEIITHLIPHVVELLRDEPSAEKGHHFTAGRA